jgi:hypothetical protein
LKNCGPETALRAAKAGLGRSLCEAGPDGLVHWIREISDFFRTNGIAIEVLAHFLQPNDVNNSKIPWVFSMSRIGWGNAVDEAELRLVVRNYFNICTRALIKHVIPSLLVWTLAQTLLDQTASTKCLGVHLLKQTKKQAA